MFLITFAVMEKKFEELLLRIIPVFMRLGIRSVTMDDIARELSISKKTIYKYVKDKPDLVDKAMIWFCKQNQDVVNEITKNSSDAIDEIIGISKHAGQQLQMIHPSVHFDLQKYYPEAWSSFNSYQIDFIRNQIEANLKRGIKEGLYRDNINTHIISHLFAAKIDMVFDPEIFPVGKFSFSDVHLEMMRYHIRGIASGKGVEVLTKKIKNENFNL